MVYLTFSIQVHTGTPPPVVPTGEPLTISLRILSFSIRSVSFFCSLSVLACQVATALDSFWIFPATDRWYSLKSFACCRMLLRYSYRTQMEEGKRSLKPTSQCHRRFPWNPRKHSGCLSQQQKTRIFHGAGALGCVLVAELRDLGLVGKAAFGRRHQLVKEASRTSRIGPRENYRSGTDRSHKMGEGKTESKPPSHQPEGGSHFQGEQVIKVMPPSALTQMS